jgi:hypothetical protein
MWRFQSRSLSIAFISLTVDVYFYLIDYLGIEQEFTLQIFKYLTLISHPDTQTAS